MQEVVDFHDITSGPPIIPMAKPPPKKTKEPPFSASKGKSIFESDDEDLSDEDIFFKDFSRGIRSSRLVIEKYSNTNNNNNGSSSLSQRKTRYSKFDLAAFAHHLHENRLSVMQLRESNIQLSQEDELELLRLLKKRKSMAVSMATNEDNNDTNDPESSSVVSPPPPPSLPSPINNENIPERPITKKPSLLLRKMHHMDDEEIQRRKSVRKSLSMDAIHHVTALYDTPTPPSPQPVRSPSTQKSLLNEPSTTPSRSTPSLFASEQPKQRHQQQQQHVQPDTTEPTTSSAPSSSSSSSRSRSIGLFGSLRQAKKAAPFRGLVRNLSNAGSAYRNRNRSASQQQQQQHQQHQDGMTPAAMAVMQHDKQIKDDSMTKDLSAIKDDIHPPPQQDGGLLTHLLAKAGKATRRSNTTKTVNMQQQRSAGGLRQRRDKTKSRVIRRTIIYVPPDSLNFMKNLNGSLSSSSDNSTNNNIPMPPLPQDMIDKIRQVDQRRRSKATSVATNTQQQENADGGYYDDESLYDYYQGGDDNSDTPQLQGLEVREMDDGTVEWGIVKKQGNRKSFYAHDNTVEHSREDDEEDGSHGIEEHLREWMKLNAQQQQQQQPSHHESGSSLSPPPIPRRSPRRRIDSSGEDHRRAKHISTITSSKDASTIDVYFAPQQTLPSLLQMIADSTKEQELAKEREKLELERMKQASVEDQLDEVMRSFQHTE